MRKVLPITILLVFISIVFYNNSSIHVSKYIWKYNDCIFKKEYEDILVFRKDDNDNCVYRYEWPYILKYDKKIGYVIFCIGERMWVKYLVTDAKIVQYVGK